MLIDDAWYELPDGTLVIVRIPFTGCPRLDDTAGQPRYLFDGARGWLSLRYNAATDAYEAAPCDLTDDDLTAV